MDQMYPKVTGEMNLVLDKEFTAMEMGEALATDGDCVACLSRRVAIILTNGEGRAIARTKEGRWQRPAGR